MKDIKFNKIEVVNIQLKHGDITADSPDLKNIRFEGQVIIDFSTIGNFSGMSEDEIKNVVNVKLLQIGLFQP